MAKILVVDDSRLVAHVAKTILVKKGHDVILAADGTAGLDAAKKHMPDLILLDLIMPGLLDGYAVCEKIKQQGLTADIPIIMLTSKAESADKVRGLEAGASDYVTKPFDEGELVARVNTHLKIKELFEELQEKNRLLEDMANRDGLTGLYNHRFFQDALSTDFKKAVRFSESLSVIMCDIDFFKKFNDDYGHQTGDVVLKTLGRLITDSLREADLAARYGGEEFSIVLYHTPAEAAFQVAECLRKSVEEFNFKDGDLVLKVTVSVGVATYPNEAIPDHKTLIDCADKALYKAKRAGRNQVVSF